MKITQNPYLNQIIDDYYQYYYKLSQIEFPVTIFQYDDGELFRENYLKAEICGEYKNIDELYNGIYSGDIIELFMFNGRYECLPLDDSIIMDFIDDGEHEEYLAKLQDIHPFDMLDYIENEYSFGCSKFKVFYGDNKNLKELVNFLRNI